MERTSMNDSKRMTLQNLWIKAAVCGFILSVILSFTGFSAQCDQLSRNILRLHVLANSDSKEDQDNKLLVRDAVLQEAAKWYGEAESFDAALASVCTHIESIEQAANRVLEKQGEEYRASVTVCDAYFPTRVYEENIVPAGKYRTVRVTLGEAQGKNWWCVLFPSVCVSGASDIEDLPKGAKAAIATDNNMQVRLKSAEIITRLMEFFDV